MGHDHSHDPPRIDPTTTHDAAKRVSDVRVELDNPHDIPATLYALDEVPIERRGIDQALDFLDTQHTIDALSAQDDGFFGEEEARFERLVLTPDFHPGGGIPVGAVAATRGFVLPQAVGNDICCGMRVLVVKNLRREELADHEPALIARLRAIFFEGKRDIAMSPVQREAMLRFGLTGLFDTWRPDISQGWRSYRRDEQEEALRHTHMGGSLESEGVFSFQDFIKASGGATSRDSQIGSVGGGNHFVEIQRVERIEDNLRAHAWGVSEGDVTIMAHSGSVGLGRYVGQHFMRLARERYPTHVKAPRNGFYPLATRGRDADLFHRYIDAMRNAANFAFANRLFLGLMVVRALEDVLGREIDAKLLYDAPHNLIWEEQVGASTRYVHRKGACPAYGPSFDEDDPFAYTGPPVIVPGSMGDASYLMAGHGLGDALCSACHGAGRKIPRQRARRLHKGNTIALREEGIRLVTPLALDGQKLREHGEIRQRMLARIYEEAPASYKDVTPVVNTIERAQIAGKVARLSPWMTIKSV